MVAGFTHRGHQIFFLVYRWDVRPICLLADDLFVDVGASSQQKRQYNVRECDRGTSGECAQPLPCVSLGGQGENTIR